MFIKFSLEESNDNTTDSTSGYTYGPAEIVDELPANTTANTVLTFDTSEIKQKFYFYDCQNFTRATVEHAVKLFNEELFEDNHHGLSNVILEEDEPLSFLKSMKQALEKAKQDLAQSHALESKDGQEKHANNAPEQSVYQKLKGFNFRGYATNQNLIFAACGTAAAVGATIAAVVAYRRYNSTE